jgi:hypothetical protein
VNDVIEKLLQRCAWKADKHFRLHGDLQTQLWLTVHRDGRQEQFETDCSAPADIDDVTAIGGLRSDMALDFLQDGVTAYAVAYPSRVVFVGAGSALLSQPPIVRHRAVTVESHDMAGNSVLGVMDIIEIAGGQPALGPLQRSARAVGRFAALLAS